MSGNRRRAMPYREALRWLLENDDTQFLSDDTVPDALSVTGHMLADIYGRDDSEVRADLLDLSACGKST